MRFNFIPSRLLLGSAAALALSAFAFTANANAQLIGSSVTGSLTFVGGSTNYFSASNGYVPAGFGNSSPGTTTVTIADPLVEFGFADGANTDTANFTNSQLFVTDIASTNAGSSSFTLLFTDNAFLGKTLSKTSDTFGNGGLSASLVGNTLTVNSPGFSGPGSFQGVFNITPSAPGAVPEPSEWAVMGMAASTLGGLMVRARRRKGATSDAAA